MTEVINSTGIKGIYPIVVKNKNGNGVNSSAAPEKSGNYVVILEKEKNTATDKAALCCATAAVFLCSLKMPSTIKNVAAQYADTAAKIKVPGMMLGAAAGTAVFALTGTGLGFVSGKIIDCINNHKNSQKPENNNIENSVIDLNADVEENNPVADNDTLSAEVSDEDFERPALIDGDFEPDGDIENNENDYIETDYEIVDE